MIESRGGYQIVDLLKYSTIDNFVIQGIYECAKNGQNKPIVLYNLVHNGVVMSPIYPQSVIINSDSVIIEYPYFDINKIIIATISINDNVVITERDIGGGGITCYKIDWIIEGSSMDNTGGFQLTFKPLVDYKIVDSGLAYVLLTAGTEYTFSISTGDDDGEIMFMFYNDMEIYFETLPSFYVTEYSTTDVESGTDVSKAITVTEVTL